jgi:acyl-coenzyme A thioesterase PaaI-like protein
LSASTSAARLFQRLGASAPGRWLFSRMVCWRAPYFASIAPRIEVLEPGRCVVRVRDRRRVRNHLGTVHAIALCNAAELAGGLATDATLPAALRWIPKGMTVRYLKKARGTLHALATVVDVDATRGAHDIHALVEVRNRDNDVVFDADITMWVSPRAASD